MSRAAAARGELPLWVAGGAFSLLAHAAAALLLSGALQQLSAPPEPRPAARISISAENARSERLPPSEARGEQVPGAEPAARRTALAAPRRMRAEPATPAAARLPPAPARGDLFIGQSGVPGATQLAPAASAGPRLRDAAPAARRTPPAALRQDRAATAPRPAERVAVAMPPGNRVAAVAADASVLEPAAAPARALPAEAPEAATLPSPSNRGRVIAVLSARGSLAAAAVPALVAVPTGAATGDRLAVAAVAEDIPVLEPAAAPAAATVASAPARGRVLAGRAAHGSLAVAAAPAAAAVPAGTATGDSLAAAAAAADAAASPPVREASTAVPAAEAAGIAAAPAGIAALAGEMPSIPAAGVASAVPSAPVAGMASDVSSAPVAGVAGSRQAALAWSAEGDARLDPRSVAAIQSFVAPAAAGAGPSLRDELDTALSDLHCSRLAAAFSPGEGEIVVRGHARDSSIAAAAVARIEAAVGPSIPVVGDLLVLPEPQCAILDAVEALGLMQSSDQADDPLVVGRASQLRYQRFGEGEAMVFELGAADFDAWLYVDYFDAAGGVVHVMPSESLPLRLAPAGSRLRLGGAGDPGPSMTVAPPFGKDILVALAASHPLDLSRPPREDGVAYLEALRDALDRTRAEAPGFRGEWVYIFVETVPRGG